MEEKRGGKWGGRVVGRKEGGRSGSANNKMGKTTLTQARRRLDGVCVCVCVGEGGGDWWGGEGGCAAVGETCF